MTFDSVYYFHLVRQGCFIKSIWPILYGPCHMGHIINESSYSSLVNLIRPCPYEIGHVIWAICYGAYDMVLKNCGDMSSEP